MIHTTHWKESSVAKLRSFYREAVLEISTTLADHLKKYDQRRLRAALREAMDEDVHHFPDLGFSVEVQGRTDDARHSIKFGLRWHRDRDAEQYMRVHVGHSLGGHARAADLAHYVGIVKQVADVAAKLELLADATLDEAPLDPDKVRAAEEQWDAKRQRDKLTPGARKVLEKLLVMARKVEGEEISMPRLTAPEKRSLHRLSHFITVNEDGFTLLKPGIHLREMFKEGARDA